MGSFFPAPVEALGFFRCSGSTPPQFSVPVVLLSTGPLSVLQAVVQVVSSGGESSPPVYTYLQCKVTLSSALSVSGCRRFLSTHSGICSKPWTALLSYVD